MRNVHLFHVAALSLPLLWSCLLQSSSHFCPAAAAHSTTQSLRVQRLRHLQSNGSGQSIGRPDRDYDSTNYNNSNNDSDVTQQQTESPYGADEGAPRRKINPFTVVLQPLQYRLSFQEAAGVRNTLESLLQLYFTETWTGASVTYVGLTQILDNSLVDADAGVVEVSVEGLIYFADGSTNVPTEEEVSLLIEQEALPESVLLQAFSLLFPDLQGATVQASNTGTTDAPTLSTQSPTVSPTEETLTEAPTDSPTVSPTGSPTGKPDEPVPTVDATPTPTAASTTVEPTLPPATLEAPAFSSVSVVQGEAPNDDNDDGVQLGPLVGGAVAGFIALAMVAFLLVKINKRRKYRKKKRSGGGVVAGGLNLEDEDRSTGYHNDEERLVEVNVNDNINFETVIDTGADEGNDYSAPPQDLPWNWKPNVTARNGNGEAGVSRQQSSPAKTVSTEEDDPEDPSSNPWLQSRARTTPGLTSPSEIASSRSGIVKDNETAGYMAGAASAMSYWTSFFHNPYPKTTPEPSAASDPPPPLKAASPGSSEPDDDGSSSFLYGEGALSDFDDAGSVDPLQITLEQHYVVKKDMMESADTSVAAPASASVGSNMKAESSVKKERKTSLQPTDMSASALAQRNNGGLIPKVSNPKSWWRASSQKGSKATATPSTLYAQGSEDEDTAYGGGGSWDPDNSELGSLGTSPSDDELFRPKVENKLEQSILNNAVRNASAQTQQRIRAGAQTPSNAWDYDVDDTARFTSDDENDNLKFDSSVSL
eukprot:CAMPEP_0178813040 /NCGR_PEP_ID=MMETSP0745-20121128/20155_1 /TAXON_ID=913974 /ORGANISM="Nitzschia punctata, Strain CCMP561" /LENGTH=762 /DNA_ID=CAMNT_0020473889 /DNA_START=77 /DNA_END=2365 /DNA_ORIENTATION=+